MGILIVFHVIVCVALIAIILIQRGRGGGLVDSFQGLDTVFGTKTTAFLTRATSVLAILFIVNCLVLAFFSLQRSRSLIGNVPVPPAVHNTTAASAPAAQAQNASVQQAPVQQQAPAQNTTTPGS